LAFGQYCGSIGFGKSLSDLSCLSRALLQNNGQIKLIGLALIHEIVGVREFAVDKALGALVNQKKDSEKKKVISTLRFLIENASRFSIESSRLAYELQQIGLPKEYSETITGLYNAYKVKLADAIKTKTMRCSFIKLSRFLTHFSLKKKKCRILRM